MKDFEGFKFRFYLYTVPGISHADSRRLALQGVDGVLFVADSSMWRVEANLRSLKELESHLTLEGYDPEAVPRVYAYNKRDLPDALPITQLEQRLNPQGKYPSFETVAPLGMGVFDSLRAVARANITIATQQASLSGLLVRPRRYKVLDWLYSLW